jgi:SAM-dependent MidA family methyltransferase
MTEPGSADLSVDVDFASLKQTMTKASGMEKKKKGDNAQLTSIFGGV